MDSIFSADYINTKLNISADLLSQVEKFKDLNPHADQQPTQYPEPELLLWGNMKDMLV